MHYPTVAQIRAAEQATGLLANGVLMGRAAHGLASAIINALRDGGVYGRRVGLVVGSGDNGGDALYAGAILARRGAAVSAVLKAASIDRQAVRMAATCRREARSVASAAASTSATRCASACSCVSGQDASPKRARRSASILVRNDGSPVFHDHPGFELVDRKVQRMDPFCQKMSIHSVEDAGTLGEKLRISDQS